MCISRKCDLVIYPAVFRLNLWHKDQCRSLTLCARTLTYVGYTTIWWACVLFFFGGSGRGWFVSNMQSISPWTAALSAILDFDFLSLKLIRAWQERTTTTDSLLMLLGVIRMCLLHSLEPLTAWQYLLCIIFKIDNFVFWGKGGGGRDWAERREGISS